MLPADDSYELHIRTVTQLIQANQRIEELTREISELKARLSVNVALQAVRPPTTPVRTVKPTTTDSRSEMLLFRWSGRFQIFSNFHSSRLRLKNVSFPTAEHAYQYEKACFHARKDIASRILRCHTPFQAKRAAKDIHQCQAWHECKADVMAKILSEKAKQCQVFRKALVNTGNKRLVHNTETDSFWGCGEDFKGTNMLGRLLEDLRQTLRFALPTPCASRRNPTPAPSVAPLQGQHHHVLHRPPVRPRGSTAPSQRPKVLVLGNSNARGVAQGLIDRGVDSCGYTLPGGTISHVTSRVRHIKPAHQVDHILLMVGDIEAADGLPSEAICARYEHLIKETRRSFPWSRIILSGLPQTGNNHRQTVLREVNSYLESVACEERLVEYVCNARAKLRDRIHLSKSSVERLCFNVSSLAKKVFM